MADNFVTNAGSGGSTFVGASLTFSGDTAIASGLFQMIITGSEGSWTPNIIVGGAGAVTAGTQRVTLASDDPAVVNLAAIEVLSTAANAILTTIDTDTGAMVTDLAAIEVLLGTIDADTGAIKTAVELLDNAISGAGYNITQLNGAAVPIGAGTEGAALRVTLATDSTGVVSIDDNGGAITVDGTVAVSGSVAVTGTFWQATQPVSGTFYQATQPVSLASPVGAGTEAAAIRVTLATDSTGVVSIDDNGGAITVDGTVAVTGMTACNTGAVVLAAGTAEIGKLAAGTALVGKVGIDQSTANANEVVVKSGTVTAVTAITNALPAGTNAIGKLAANSGVDIGDVDVTSIAAGTNTIGGVIAQTSTSAAYDGTTACTIKRASGVATAENANTLVAAVAGYQIRVLALSLIATSTTAVSLYIYNGDKMLLGDSTNEIVLDMDGVGGPAGLVLPWNPGGWFQTDTDEEALAIDLSAAQPVVWAVTYIEVT